MTIHYGGNIDNLTVKKVLNGMIQNFLHEKHLVPSAYAILSEADNFAYECWRYMEYKKQGGEKSVEEWCGSIPRNIVKKRHQKFVKLLTEIAEKLSYSAQ